MKLRPIDYARPARQESPNLGEHLILATFLLLFAAAFALLWLPFVVQLIRG